MCNSDHIQPKLGTCVEQKLHKKDSTLHADKVQSWKMTKYILKIFLAFLPHLASVKALTLQLW